MKLTLIIIKDGVKINTIKSANAKAWQELTALLIHRINKSKCSDARQIINKNGLHEIKGQKSVSGGYKYLYHFTGAELENLPIICK